MLYFAILLLFCYFLILEFCFALYLLVLIFQIDEENGCSSTEVNPEEEVYAASGN